MNKYEITLRPVALAGGIHELNPQKRLMMEGLIDMIVKFFQSSDEVHSSKVNERYSIIIESEKDIMDSLTSKLSDKAIIERIS